MPFEPPMLPPNTRVPVRQDKKNEYLIDFSPQWRRWATFGLF